MRAFTIRHARIVPFAGPAPSEPVDVRVEDGRVSGVAHQLPKGEGPDYEADGRWLIPGLWDQHVHLGQWALMSQRVDLSAATSAAEALSLVATRLDEAPEIPVVSWGHRSAIWRDQLSVADLDRVTGRQPTILLSGDGHHAWLNTAALEGLGLRHREGPVEENEWFDTFPRLASLVGHDGTTPEAYQHAMHEAAAKGVVGVVDLEFGQPPEAWAERAAADAELLRVRVGCYPGSIDSYASAGLRTGDVLPGCSALITMGPLKVISDGSLNTRTAWCHDPYAGTGTKGAPNYTPDELLLLANTATKHGWELAAHAIGDAALSSVLEAFAQSGVGGSIEHAQLLRREDSRRLAQLGLQASVQPAHLLDDRDVAEEYWPDRTERCFPLRWLRDDGVRIVMGSDAPVSPLDPWLAMSAAVHRTADEREPWHPEQALTSAEALASSTDGQPTVGQGSPADLVLLESDPLDSENSFQAVEVLGSMRVAATWINGNLVYGELN